MAYWGGGRDVPLGQYPRGTADGSILVCTPDPASVEQVAISDRSSARLRAAPNPSGGETLIWLASAKPATLPKPGAASASSNLEIFDAGGRLVAKPPRFTGGAGVADPLICAWKWDRRDLGGRLVTPGVYFVRLRGSEERGTKLVVIR